MVLDQYLGRAFGDHLAFQYGQGGDIDPLRQRHCDIDAPPTATGIDDAFIYRDEAGVRTHQRILQTVRSDLLHHVLVLVGAQLALQPCAPLPRPDGAHRRRPDRRLSQRHRHRDRNRGTL